MRRDEKMRVCIYLLSLVLFAPGMCFAQPAWVNDGLGADEDWTNSTTQLSANWAVTTDPQSGPADGYKYAIGTKPGATDVTRDWISTQRTSVTHTGLSLRHGLRYYFAVKAVYSAGKRESSPTYSDGITVDTNPPSSQVNPLPSIQNTLSFIVNWSGRDDLSGVRHYDIQSKDGDGPWRDWLTRTTLTSSTFTGVNGHIYYFRCRASDNAGNQESYPTTPDTSTRISIAPPLTLNITPSPTSLIFYRGETSKDVTYTLALSGELIGVSINQERVTYEQDGRVLRRETPAISERISPRGSIRLSRSITLDDTLRSMILGGRAQADFTLRRIFSGIDDRGGPISTEATIDAEVRTTPSEVFNVTGVEIILPDGPFGQDEEVRGRIRFSTSGPPGDVAGNIYIDNTGWRSFNVSGVEDGDETQTLPLPTDAVGEHTIRVALTRPNAVEDEATYEIREGVSVMDRLTTLNVLKEDDTPWAILEDIEAEAVSARVEGAEGDCYELNGTGTLRITSLENREAEAINIQNLVIEFNPSDPPNSRIHSGSLIKEREGENYIFSLYEWEKYGLTASFLDVTKIEYRGGWNHLRIDADLNIPVINEKLYSLQGITVRKDGIEGKSFDTEHSFDLCGLEFRLCEVRISEIDHPPLELGYAGGEIYALLSGEIRLRQDRSSELLTSFSGFRFGVNVSTGNIAVSGNFSLTNPFRFIPNNDYFNLTRLTFEFDDRSYGLRAEAEINLPEPFDSFGTQTANFRFTQGGNIEGDIDVINEPSSERTSSERRREPELMGNDPTQVPFWVCRLDLTYLGIELSFNDGNLSNDHSKIKLGADLWVEAKEGWLRQELGTRDDPCFTIDFDGNLDWSLPAEVLVLRDQEIDLGAVWLSIENLSIQPTPFALVISAGFGIDVEVVESSVGVEGLKVDIDGNLDWGTFREGVFRILNVVNVEVESIEYDGDGGEISFDSEGEGRRQTEEQITVSKYFRVADANINLGRDSGIFSGEFDELLIYEKATGETKFAIKGVDISIASFNLLSDFEYRNPVIGVAGGIRGAGLDLTVVGKVGREPDGDLTFGLFVAADIPDVTLMPPQLLILTEIGGGFFYNPERSDIDSISDMCGLNFAELRAKAGNNVPESIPRPSPDSFAVLLYAAFACIDENIVRGQCLLTLTGGYFSFDARAEVLVEAGECLDIEGALHLLVSWSPTFAEGGIWVDVDILEGLVDGSGYFEFYVYSLQEETVWAVMGGADLEVISLIDISAEFFIGPPGFMISGGIRYGLDLWIVSGGFSFEMMLWYEMIPPETTFGAYVEGRVWGEVLGGLVGAEAGMYGALIIPPPELIVGGYLSVEVFWIEVWSGNIWISIGGRHGIDGGTGRNSRLDQILDEARNMADYMNREIENVKQALEEMQATLGTLDPKTRELLGTMLVGLESNLVLPSFYWGEGDAIARTRPSICNDIMNNILWDRRTYFDGEPKGLFQIRAERNILFNSFRDGVNAIAPLQERMMAILEKELPKLEALPTVGEQQEMFNPVRGMQYRTVGTRTLQVGYDLDQAEAERQKEKTREAHEDAQEYIRTVLVRAEELKELLAKTDELLYGRRMVETAMRGRPILLASLELYMPGLIAQPPPPTLIDLANRYRETFNSLMGYYTKYFNYLNRAYEVSVQKVRELISPLTVIPDPEDINAEEVRTSIGGTLKTALESQRNALPLDAMKNLTRARRGSMMNLYDSAVARIREEGKDLADLPAEERPQEPESINEAWTIEDWRTRCLNYGMELWYRIPLYGYGEVASSISLLPVRKDLYERKMNFINAWADFTTHLDRVYDCRVRLYELLYDLYDELSTTYGAYPIPVREGKIDIPSLNMIEFKEIILERPIEGVSRSGSEDIRSVRGGMGDIRRGVLGTGVGRGAGVSLDARRFLKPGVSLQPGVTLPTFATYYGTKKHRIFTLLLPPGITSFTGECRGIDSQAGPYAELSCQFGATHPVGVVEYGLKVEQPEYQCEYEREFGTITQEWFSIGNPEEKRFKMFFVPGETPHGEGRWVYLRARGPAGNYIWRKGRFDVGYMEGSISSINTQDSTPPCTPVIDDGGEWTNSGDMLWARWEATDNESGIAEYKYRVVGPSLPGIRTDLLSGRTEVISQPIIIKDWTSSGPMRELNIRGLGLENNTTYYIEVKARNGAGGWSSVGRSDGITTDLRPPRVTGLRFSQVEIPSNSPPRISQSFNRISPVSMLAASSVVLSTPPNSLSASWSAVDDESGVGEYSYRLLDEEGSELRAGTTRGTRITLRDIPLLNNKTYTLSLQAKDNVGWVSEPATSTVVVRFDDSTPPPRPLVRQTESWEERPDGLDRDYNLRRFIYSSSKIKMVWDDVVDPESGIYGYYVAIGTEVGNPNVLPWTSIGRPRPTEYRNDNLRLQEGRDYYLMVKAVNGVGLESEVGSVGPLLVDQTPLTLRLTRIGFGFTSIIRIEAGDSGSGLRRYYYTVYRSEHGVERVMFSRGPQLVTGNELDTQLDLGLGEGRYRVSVRIEDYARWYTVGSIELEVTRPPELIEPPRPPEPRGGVEPPRPRPRR